MVVVLPAPFGPKNPIISPSPIFNEISFKTSFVLNFFDILSRTIMFQLLKYTKKKPIVQADPVFFAESVQRLFEFSISQFQHDYLIIILRGLKICCKSPVSCTGD